jgi:hypothetical protein
MGMYDELVGRIERAEARIDDLEGDVRFLKDLLANPHLSPSQKITLVAVRDFLRQYGGKPGQLTEISIAELGKLIGLSRQTAGDNVMTLAQMGAIARREWMDITVGRYGRKVYRKCVAIGATLFTERPGDLRPLQVRNQGGKREKRCPYCQSADLLIYKTTYCTCCKKEIDCSTEQVNDDGRTLDEFVDDVIRRDQERGLS